MMPGVFDLASNTTPVHALANAECSRLMLDARPGAGVRSSTEHCSLMNAFIVHAIQVSVLDMVPGHLQSHTVWLSVL